MLQTAQDLVGAKNRKPRQANLRRAVSTIYYALFHCLAQCCADLIVGGGGAARGKPAWKQVYRALDHRTAKDGCQQQKLLKKFPKDIEEFANEFVSMQAKRHAADYDPSAQFYKSAVVQDIANARSVIDRFQKVPMTDRRAFAVLVLFKARP